MKNYKFLLSLVAVAALMLTNLAASAQEGGRDGVVTVVNITGHGEYSLDGGHAWIPLVAGKELSPGSVVRSGPLSIVDLLIGKSSSDAFNDASLNRNPKTPALNLVPQIERNVIRLRPNTTLGIDKLIVPGSDASVISDCQLDLKKGKILASVKKVSPSSEYLIKIPNGVAAVRGTTLSLSTDGTSSGTTCSVISGTVWISFTLTDANGNPLTGPDGQPLAPIQISIEPGQTFGLTPALLQTLIQDVQGAAPGTSPASLIQSLIAAATSQITSLSPAEIQTLETALAILTTPHHQEINLSITVDNGVPIHVSSQ